MLSNKKLYAIIGVVAVVSVIILAIAYSSSDLFNGALRFGDRADLARPVAVSDKFQAGETELVGGYESSVDSTSDSLAVSDAMPAFGGGADVPAVRKDLVGEEETNIPWYYAVDADKTLDADAEDEGILAADLADTTLQVDDGDYSNVSTSTNVNVNSEVRNLSINKDPYYASSGPVTVTFEVVISNPDNPNNVSAELWCNKKNIDAADEISGETFIGYLYKESDQKSGRVSAEWDGMELTNQGENTCKVYVTGNEITTQGPYSMGLLERSFTFIP